MNSRLTLKEKFKQYIKNYKRLKKKAKEAKELEKKKKEELKKQEKETDLIINNNRVKNFIYGFLSIIIGIFGLSFSNRKRQRNKIEVSLKFELLKDITIEIDDLEKIIISEYTIPKITQSLTKISNNIVEAKEQIKTIPETEQSTFKKTITSLTTRTTLIKTILNNKANYNKTIAEVIASPEENTLEEQIKVEAKEDSVKDSIIDPFYEVKNWVRNTNSKLESLKYKLDKLKIKIAKSTTYNELYDYEKQLKKWEELIFYIKKDYEKYKNIPGFKDMFDNMLIYQDKFKLREDISYVEELYSDVINQLKIIDYRKDVIYYQNKKINAKPKEPKLEDKANKKELSIEQGKNSELNEAGKMIDKHIDKLEILVNKTKIYRNNKIKLLPYLDDVMSKTANIFLNAGILVFFKNKLLGVLTALYMANNAIRAMRRMINPKYDGKFKRLGGLLGSRHEIDSIGSDTLKEAALLRQDIINTYGSLVDKNPQIKQILVKLDIIEEQIRAQQRVPQMINQPLQKTKDKQLVKKKVEKYGRN